MTALVPYLAATGALTDTRRRRPGPRPLCPHDYRPCRRPRCIACRTDWRFFRRHLDLAPLALAAGMLTGAALAMAL